MSVRLRLVVGPVVVCDLELFATEHNSDDEAPPQLNGGQGQIVEPYVEAPIVFGFQPPRRRHDR